MITAIKKVEIKTTHQLILNRYTSEGYFVSTVVKDYETEEVRNKAYFTESGKVSDGSGDYIVVSLDKRTVVHELN